MRNGSAYGRRQWSSEFHVQGWLLRGLHLWGPCQRFWFTSQGVSEGASSPGCQKMPIKLDKTEELLK